MNHEAFFRPLRLEAKRTIGNPGSAIGVFIVTTTSTHRDDLATSNPSSLSHPAGSNPGTPIAGPYDIVLVADRQEGTLYRFFRNWRFESRCAFDSQEDKVVAVPIDPQAMVSSGTRYLMEYIGERVAATEGGTAAFTWSVAFAGASDPLAEGLAQAKRLLAQACPAPDALLPTFPAWESA